MIAAILVGETQLYHDLIRPYERRVYAMALSFMKNEADAEEVAQEAFMKAFRNLSSFRAEAKFSTWLISITLNEARTRLRRQSEIKTFSFDEAPGGEEPISPALLRDWKEIPSEVVERQEVRELLHKAIEKLPELYKGVFFLRDIEERSVSETAQALNISVAVVKVRLHRARMMLQKELTPTLKTMCRASKKRWFPWS